MELGELPEDVVSIVLCHLPSPWVVQSRLVCKQWHRILCSSHFALQWAAKAPHIQSLCLLILPQTSTLPSTISALHISTLLSIPLPLPPPHLSSPLAASPLGLLLSSPSSSSSPFSLFHPISRLSLPLPPSHLIGTPLSAGLAPSSPLRILAIGAPKNPPLHTTVVAEIYTSVTSSWAALPCLPSIRSTTRIPRSTPSIVWWKEAFCMLWGNCILTCKAQGVQLAPSRGQEGFSAWGSIELPTEPRIWDARFVTLHVIKDRLFVEGNFQEQCDFLKRYPLRIGVVEFDSTEQQWKETGFMPDSLATRLCKQQYPAHCFYTAYSDALSGHIYFTPFRDEASSEETEIEIVRFDVDSGCWSSISKLVPAASAALLTCPSFKGLTFQASR